MASLDLELDVGGAGSDGYQVTARAADGSETAAVLRLPLPPNEFDALVSRAKLAVLASSAVARRTPTEDERPMQELGALLFDALFGDRVRALLVSCRLRAAAEGRRLRLVLRVRSPELARLPWEFLFDADEDDYLCLNTPLIRYPAVLEPHRPLHVQPPLRILGMTARPGDHDALDTADERRRLHAAVADLQRRGLVELSWVTSATWSELQAAMRRGPWHVFHFIGHGGFDAAAAEGTLMLVGDAGRAYPLHGSSLAMLLRGHPSMRLVVLNACRTAQATALDPFSSVAGSLMRRGVPAVLAMQFEITDRAAIECSRAFYGAIADRLPVDLAVTEARQAIRLSVPNTLEWGTPVLYLRSADGNVFTLADAPAGSDARAAAVAARPDHADLAALYTAGLAAFYTEEWDDAVEIFRRVTALDHGYRDAVERLDASRRQQQLARQYAAALGAGNSGAWAEVVERLEALLAVEPGYRDCDDRLAYARRRLAVARLHEEVAALFQAGQWAAVIAVGARLAEIDPEHADPDDMVTQARARLAGRAAVTPEPTHRVPAAGPRTRFLREPVRVSTFRVGSEVKGLAFRPDGGELAVACKDGICRLVDPVTGEQRLSLNGSWYAVAFSPDGTRLAITDVVSVIRIFAVVDGTMVAEFTPGHGVFGIAFSFDGDRLATAGSDRRVRIWTLSAPRELLRMRHDGFVASAWAVAFDRAGDRVASGAGDKTARIWHATTGKQLLRVGHGKTVHSVAFSPDGGRLATASDDGFVRILDCNTGRELLRLAPGGPNPPRDVRFDPEGRHVLVTGFGTMNVWDATSGAVIGAKTAIHETAVAAISADGGRAAFAKEDSIEVWRLTENVP